MSFLALLRKPSAFLPVAMSCAVVATELITFARSGIIHEADEGTAAHIFQLLMAVQLPILVFFAVKWLPRFPRQALQVMAVQAGAALAALAPVFYFKL